MARLLPLLAFLAATGGAAAEPVPAPTLAAASSFGQTWDPAMLAAADAMGVRDLRDELYWSTIEAEGRYRYRNFRVQYPALLAARGMTLTLIVNNGHPDHDGGVTPYTPEAVAAFADYAAALVTRFPAIDAIEVGNEMNSDRFASGPMRDGDMATKARIYTALLRATHDAVKAARPDVRIIGGAALAIPLAWFSALAEAGAPAWMDSLALHPYTTPPEQLGRQMALLRALPGYGDLPLEVTEFGSNDAAAAPAALLKNYCEMALAGATRTVWYPLNPRGDGMAPLIGADNTVTEVGRSFQSIQAELVGLPVTDASPDPFTYGCRFGERALILWGAPRAVSLEDPLLAAVDPTGEPLRDPELSRARPVLILSQGAPLTLGGTVRLGPQRVIADSFDQFAYPGQPGQPGDPFERFARAGGSEIPLTLRPGQEVGGVPWTPYLGSNRDGMLRMDAEFLLPSMSAAGGTEIVHRYRAPEAMRVALDARVTPTAESSDGVVVTIRLGGAVIDRQTVTGDTTLHEADLDLAKGEVLEIAVGPGASAAGDASLYRFTLRRAP